MKKRFLRKSFITALLIVSATLLLMTAACAKNRTKTNSTDTASEISDSADIVSVEKVEKTSFDEDGDVYTVYLSNGETYDFSLTKEGDDQPVSAELDYVEMTAGGDDTIYTIHLTNGTSHTFSSEDIIVNKIDKYGTVDGKVHITEISEDYSPKAAGDIVLENSSTISHFPMMGVHDASFVVVGDKAYVVYEANDVQAGESAAWNYEYCAMSVFDIKTGDLENVIKFAESGKQFDNLTLPAGAAFVPRVLKKDDDTLRVFFSSEQTEIPTSQLYYIDFDVQTETFSSNAYKLQLKTGDGAVDFTASAYYNAALSENVKAYDTGYGAFLFDFFNVDEQTYIAVNNFGGGQNALAKFDDTLSVVEIIGHIGMGTTNVKTTESGIVRKTDGTWMCILREERNLNCRFSYSENGIDWTTPREKDFVTGSTNSKPILRRFGNYYIMGYNVGFSDLSRATFVLDYSTDGKTWAPLYVFDSPTSFQYPTFDIYDGQMYFAATTGNKENIIFGKLPIVLKDGELYVDDTARDEEVFVYPDGYNYLASVQTNRDGTTFDVTVKRDELGVYFHAESDRYNAGDKVFFMLDTDGTKANTSKNPYNMMFRMSKNAGVKALSADNSYAYLPLAAFDGVKYSIDMSDGVSYDLFVSYSAINEIAPQSDFTDGVIYCGAYGANGSYVYHNLYGSDIIGVAPISYYSLDAENVLSKREDFNVVTSSVKCSASGADFKVSVMRDDNGIYMIAEAEKMVNGDKLFFMLDTAGTGTSANSDTNLMFKFGRASNAWDNQVQSRHTFGSTTRGYKNLTDRPSVSFTTEIYDNSVTICVFIPYSAITEIAPNAIFDVNSDIYFTVYGANGSYVENITYNGTSVNWNAPSTYLILTADNETQVR